MNTPPRYVCLVFWFLAFSSADSSPQVLVTPGKASTIVFDTIDCERHALLMTKTQEFDVEIKIKGASAWHRAPGHSDTTDTIFVNDACQNITVEIRAVDTTNRPFPVSVELTLIDAGHPSQEAWRLISSAQTLFAQNEHARNPSISDTLAKAAEILHHQGGESYADIYLQSAYAAAKAENLTLAVNILDTKLDTPQLDGTMEWAAALELAASLKRKTTKAKEATEKLLQALAFYEENGLELRSASAINTLALLHVDEGKLDEAALLYEQAHRIYERAGDQKRVGILINNIGGIHYQRGDLKKAELWLKKSLQIHQQSGNRKNEADALGNLASLATLAGDYIKRLRILSAVRKTYDQVGFKEGIARTDHRIGLGYQAAGLNERAIKYLNRALRVRNKLDHTRDEAVSLRVLGELLAAEGRYGEALENLEKSIALERRGDNPTNEGLARLERQRVLVQQTRSAPSDDEVRAAIALIDQGGNLFSLVQGLITQATISQDTSEKMRTASKATALAEEAGFLNLALDARLQVALTLSMTGEFEEAARLARAVRDSASNLLRVVANPSLSARYSKIIQAAADIEIENRADISSFDSFAISEGSKSSLLETLIGRHKQSGDNDPELTKLISRVSVAHALLPQLPERSRTLAKKKLDSDLADLDVYFEKNESLSAPSEVIDIKSALPPNAAFLAYRVGQKKSFRWLIHQGQIEISNLPGRDHISQLVEAWQAETLPSRQPRGSAREASSQLYDLLIGELPPVDHIFLSPHDVLHELAFPTLIDPLGNFLIETAAVTISVNPRSRARPDAELAADGALIVVDPTLHKFSEEDARSLVDLAVRPSERLPPLRFAYRDAAAIKNIHGQDVLEITGQRATKSAYYGAKPHTKRILHFASHAITDKDNMHLTGLLLAGKEGSLVLSEILNHRLAADLVYLNSCSSSDGISLPGEGLVGLAYAFLSAGAKTVVAAGWPIRDDASSQLAQHFYHYSARMDLASALRLAQQQMIRNPRFANPVNWGAYSLYSTGFSGISQLKSHSLASRLPFSEAGGPAN